jgi:transketolase
MEVYCPANNEDMCLMLETIWGTEAPTYLRANTRPAPAAYQHKPFEIGKAEVISEGADITILTYGMLFENCLLAKEILEKQGLSVGLVNLRSLKPIDENLLLSLAKGSSRLVTVEDHFHVGGLNSILAELFQKHRLAPLVQNIDLGDNWFKPALLGEVLEYEGFTPEKLAARIANF